LFSLYQLRKLWERPSKVLGPDFLKSHTFPHMKNLEYNQNSPKKKKCCTFSRYSNWKYWAMFLVIFLSPQYNYLEVAMDELWIRVSTTHLTPSSKLFSSVLEGIVKSVEEPWDLSGFIWLRELSQTSVYE